MTLHDTAGYYAAIAQIVPVLALALVLEARLFATRLSRKQAFKRRKRRIAWGFWLWATWLSLVFSEGSALAALVGEPPDLATPSNRLMVVLTFLATINGFVLVSYVPVSRIYSAALGDTTDLRFWLPWSKVRRLRSDIFKHKQNTMVYLKSVREAAHVELLAAAGAATDRSELDRLRRRAEDELPQRGPDEQRFLRKGLREAAELDSKLAEFFEQCWQRYRDSRELEVQLEEYSRLADERLERIEKLRRGGRGYEKTLRKLLAEAGAH